MLIYANEHEQLLKITKKMHFMKLQTLLYMNMQLKIKKQKLYFFKKRFTFQRMAHKHTANMSNGYITINFTSQEAAECR